MVVVWVESDSIAVLHNDDQQAAELCLCVIFTMQPIRGTRQWLRTPGCPTMCIVAVCKATIHGGGVCTDLGSVLTQTGKKRRWEGGRIY